MLASEGANITRMPGPKKDDLSILIAFIEDPDGYKIKLVERTKALQDDERVLSVLSRTHATLNLIEK
jgi:hypothetical protein